jgi:hypothetical protein
VASEPRGWVVTAPPLFVLPAGANLMAWEVCRELVLRCVDLRYTQPHPRGTKNDYASTGIPERIRNRKELHEGSCAPRPEAGDFEGRAVLVINDINVTGTQQLFIERTLQSVWPASIHFLYVVQVDPELGRSHPEVEHSLNHLSLETFEDFVEVVTRADIDYTSRCMARLFDYPLQRFAEVIRSCDESRRARLRELAQAEGAYAGAEWRARLELLSL